MELKMQIGESYLEFCNRVFSNYKQYGFATARDCFKELTGIDMFDNARKYRSGVKNIQKAYDSGYYKKFVGDVVEVKREELNSFYKSDEQVEVEDKEFLLKSNQQLRKQVQSLRDSNNLLRAEQRHLYRFDDIMKDTKEKMVDVANSYTKHNPLPNVVRLENYNGAVFVAHLSDNHFNQTVDLAHNKYNFEVAKQRLNTLFSKYINEIQCRGIKRVIIAMTGDMNNLSKLKEQYLTNELPSRMEATIKGFEILSKQVDRLLNLGLEVEFVSCIGNEARNDMFEKLGNVESITKDNFDYMLFQQLKARYGQSCKFHNEGDSLEFVLEVKGKNILLTHGDKLSHGNLVKEVSKIRDKYMNNYRIFIDYILIGHLHSYQTGDGYCRCSSIVGSGEYSYKGLHINGNDISQACHIVTDDEIISMRIGCK